MTGQASASAATVCSDLVRDGDRTRYIQTLLSPAAHRRALFALHAFNVEVSGVATHVTQAMAGEVRLQWWRDALSGTAHGDVAAHPVASELQSVLQQYGLPAKPLLALIDAHEADLYADPMPSMAALQSYLDNTSGTLFSAAAMILGARPDAVAGLAHHAGIACGLTATMAALPAHAVRGQVFLPADMLSAFGIDPADILARVATPQLHALLKELRGQARAHLDAAQTDLVTQPSEVRSAFLLLALAQEMLTRLARVDFDPFKAAALSRLRTLWLLWKTSKAG